MANEGEIVVLGIVIAFAGFLLIISPTIDNLATVFTGIKDDKLQGLSILFLFGGILLPLLRGFLPTKNPEIKPKMKTVEHKAKT